MTERFHRTCQKQLGRIANISILLGKLKECSRLGDLQMGKRVHADAVESGEFVNIFVANSIINMYAKCGSMADAREAFDSMCRHNAVSWTSLILGYTGKGENDMALQLFECMQSEGCAPDARTFVAALKACMGLVAKEGGVQVNGKLVKKCCLQRAMAIHSVVASRACRSDIFVSSALIDMYAKCGHVLIARAVFDRMPCHDVVTYTTLMMGYVDNGHGHLALQIFACLLSEGYADNRVFLAATKACTSLIEEKQDKVVQTECLEKGKIIRSLAVKNGCTDIYVASALLDLFAKCGSMKDAREIFDTIPQRNVVSWTVMILGYAENGEADMALSLFARMQPEGYEPNAVTLAATLKACGSVAALEFGKNIHAQICRRGLENDATVGNSLVSFYGKCGNMVEAKNVFDSISMRSSVTWNALLAGFSRQGDIGEVLNLFEQMQKEEVEISDITFLSILNACSHAGLVDKGKEYFDTMCSKYGFVPTLEHFTCMIDIFGRANRIEDAVALVRSMPVEPDTVTWTTILSACRKWANVETGKLAFESLLKLDKKLDVTYVLMANIYGSLGMWEERSKVYAMQNDARAWKKPGQSWWTDEAGIVHKFLAEDTSHPNSEDIRSKLKQLMLKMKEEGYVADVGSVVRDITDDEKEDALCGHSERLAIAYALINTAEGTLIRIVKNLRICDDCHKATAIISKIEQRHIVCRDASRFHVFRDGVCSCGDFW